jgi:leucyl aminopeptidase
MKINFAKATEDNAVLVVPVFAGNAIHGVEASLKKFITDALAGETFKGQSGQTLTLRGSGVAQKVILLGAGDAKDFTEKSAKKLAAPLYRVLSAEGAKQATINADAITPAQAAHLADGLLLHSYTFDKYKTEKNSSKPEDVTLLTKSEKQASEIFGVISKTTESVFWASDLCNEPANILNPQTYAEKIKAELEPFGIKVTVLDQNDMKKLGMGAALAVGQGSPTPPCMVVMEYDGTDGKQKQPLALVGKGITFDSGGISLKPGAGMGDMSLDMSGSAAVAGTIRALAARGAKTKVVGIAAIAENMPGGLSYRPGDIVKSLSGKTIYVGNTDAEGRLVLCDAMTYIQRTFNPHTVVDLATLTGAAVGALGTEFAAVFANDNHLWKKFNAASGASGEKIWRMPLTETGEFTKAVKANDRADLTNLAGGPGACTAAAFLHEFIEKDDKGADKRKWMHIDMAGPGMPPGQIRKGWGIMLLDQLVRDHFELAEPKAVQPKTAKPSP